MTERKLSALGAAFFLSNQTAKAGEVWQRVLDEGDESERDQITKSLILFQTLERYDLGEKVREKISPSDRQFFEKQRCRRFFRFSKSDSRRCRIVQK